MVHRAAARNAYSWRSANHERTKQSKWLDQNVSDMEEKVEYVIKIIEEDGDSFAQRAEMYYKKRSELLNFVEEFFQGYRALADRYDHISKELQSAECTIASVCLENVQLPMDEEDEEILPTTTTTASSPFSDSKQPSKSSPAAPKLNIPKVTKIPLKSSKAPTRLMSKKGLLKMSGPTTTTDAKKTSGMSKAEALEEIDKLQKDILGLQTEKEFVKRSYENGVAKYWEIEGQVSKKQSKVNLLQDEFGIGTFIDDDEARTLVAATALKLCQETLIGLEEKLIVSDEEARIECRRIQESYEKLKIFKEKFANQTLEFVSETTKVKDFNQQVENIGEKERIDLELLKEKIKKLWQLDSSGESSTMSELAEKIDGLVEKAITLETSVSSQNALIKRLQSEANELQGHLRGLEDNKEALLESSKCKSNKIRELEEEFLRVQNLNQNVENQNRLLQIRFAQSSFSVDNLCEKLPSVKQEIVNEGEAASSNIFRQKEFLEKQCGRRASNWTCPGCGNLNFYFRSVCHTRKCKQARPADSIVNEGEADEGEAASSNIFRQKEFLEKQCDRRAGTWTCPGCGNYNFYFRSVCHTRKCKQARPADSKFTAEPMQPMHGYSSPAPNVYVPGYNFVPEHYVPYGYVQGLPTVWNGFGLTLPTSHIGWDSWEKEAQH